MSGDDHHMTSPVTLTHQRWGTREFPTHRAPVMRRQGWVDASSAAEPSDDTTADLGTTAPPDTVYTSSEDTTS